MAGSVGKGQQQRLLSLFEDPQAAVSPESSDTSATGPGVGVFEEVDLMLLTPPHQLLPGKAGVGPQQDLDLGPDGAQAGDDALDLGEGVRGGINVGGLEQGREQRAVGEDVEGEIAIAL